MYIKKVSICFKTILCFLFLSFLLSLIVGCKKEDKMIISEVNINGEIVKKYQGEEIKTIKATSQTLFVSVNKTSGDIYLKIYEVDNINNVAYEGRDMPKTFTVNLMKDKNYYVYVKCNNFIGSYEINLKNEA